MIYFLSLLPIIVLVALSLLRGVKEAVTVGWLVTTLLFFFWGADINQYLGALGVSMLTTINILMIVLGAVFLYNIMQHTGMIEQISHSLDRLHPSKEIRFFLLALGLTAFFEGVAGFGTPGAIVPLILVALGFGAILSVSVVLLFDGLVALFGAVGTPVLTGLQVPLGLSESQVYNIAITAALLVALAGVLVLLLVFRMVTREHGLLEHRKEVLLLYTFFAVPFCFFAWLVPELATVLGSLTMLGLSVLYLGRGKRPVNLKPWLPYAVLAFLLLLPKLWEPLKGWIGMELVFPGMFGTTIDGAIKPLQSPLLPFLVVGMGVAFFKKSESLYLGELLMKIGRVFVVLFPSVAIAQLMIHSGVTQPSMVRYIAELMSSLGTAYVVVAPFIGVLGAFITGSTTISNIVFGASQLETAVALNIEPVTMLALQLSGASMGNAICLFNIIAAASVANIKEYRLILSNNMGPTLLATLLVGLLGMVLFFL
ncbi:L-lactate permease [Pontibacter locisalis]|uniref:L-lactate permease n=1 Tax=Pontibacter locisalis TaxID=1719035 RepID=A0ABW5IJL6_9BACT